MFSISRKTFETAPIANSVDFDEIVKNLDTRQQFVINFTDMLEN